VPVAVHDHHEEVDELKRWSRIVLPALFAIAVAGAPPVAAQTGDAHSPNMALLANRPQSAFTNSDLAFWGNRAYAGNYGGFRIFDISNPSNPTMITDFSCPGPQNDISVWNNDADAAADLLFLSVDSVRFDSGGPSDDCTSAAADTSTAQQEAGWEGVRIFDINNETTPVNIANVPTDCGSHTHTLFPTAANDFLYIYVASYPTSGQTNDLDFENDGATQGSATADQVAGARENGTECLEPEPRPNSATGDWEANKGHAKISIIKVNLADPAAADDAVAVTEATATPCDGAGLADTCLSYPAVIEWAMPTGTRVTHLQSGSRTNEFTGCHDIAVFVELNLMAGACWDEGILWDVSDPAAPDFLRRVRNNAVDLLFHSATFTWDGKHIAFEDEAGGGTDDRCRDPNDLQGRMWFYDQSLVEQGSFKIPRPQAKGENCTAHNYNVIPQMSGRHILASAWYSGGTSMIDFTNPATATEIGYFDANSPLAGGTTPVDSDVWSSYWYNGNVYVNDIQRGFEVLSFTDHRVSSPVTLPFLNPQTQMSTIPQTPVLCEGEVATHVGTAGKDKLTGTEEADVIATLGGKDTVKALGGNDTVCAGSGNDKVSGGPGDDLLLGEKGNDKLSGQEGDDELRGKKGKDDTCNGGKGKDAGKGCEVDKNIP
jgi:hemolysin type calcium-binding protein/LVIVD repeat-containing protein